MLGALTVVAGIPSLPPQHVPLRRRDLPGGRLREGISALAQAFTTDRSVGARIFYVVSGVVSVVAGLIVATFPGDSLVPLTRFGGFMLVFIGIAEVVTSILARRAAAPTA